MQVPLPRKRSARKQKSGLNGELQAVVAQSRRADYQLRLYVSGSTLKSARAVENIKRICEEHLKDRYELEVIDLYQQPDLARGDQIVAVPTLLKRFPQPPRRLVGDLSNTENVLLGLDINPNLDVDQNKRGR